MKKKSEKSKEKKKSDKSKKEKNKIRIIKSEIEINEIKEESALEENLEQQEEIIEDNRFQNFLQSSGRRISAPVLEQIAISQASPVFVRTKQKNELEENDDSFRYDLRAGEEKDSSKYKNYSGIKNTALNIDTEKIGRNIPEIIKQEAQFMQSPELKGITSTNLEKYTASIEKIDNKTIGRNNFFETRKSTLQEKKMKYEPLR